MYPTRNILGLLAPLLLLISCAGDVNSDLINAAAKGQAESVEALLAKGADVNAKGKGDRTALMFAAVSGHADAARVLLDHGADPVATLHQRYNFLV